VDGFWYDEQWEDRAERERGREKRTAVGSKIGWVQADTLITSFMN
jgi:hypothetical protein